MSSCSDTTYAVRSDVEDIYGITNVSKWADLDADEDATKIHNRICRAHARAYDELNNRLRGCRYLVPFDSPYPSVITYLEALYVGIWLYSNRGVTDYDSEGKVQDQLQNQRNEFDMKIRMIHSGKYTVDAPSKVKNAAPKAN